MSLQTPTPAAPPPSILPQDVTIVRSIRGLIWLYLILLLFEGAFRKWLTPNLSAPLLIVRDPVVILIYFLALAGNAFPTGRMMNFFWAIVFGSSAFGLVAEQFGTVVFLFGWRTNFLHLPLIFLMPRVMSYRHVVGMGRWILIIAIPMTVLVVQQFLASPTDLINTAAGGAGMQLGTSGGKVRASGTFTFVVGVVCFYAIVAGFVINALMKRGTYRLWLTLPAAIAVIVAVATSGSRSAVAGVLIVVASVAFVLAVKPELIGRAIGALVVLLLLALISMEFGVVRMGTEVMQKRFEDAGGRAPSRAPSGASRCPGAPASRRPFSATGSGSGPMPAPRWRPAAPSHFCSGKVNGSA
jgi:hypothetical protein